MENSLCPRRRSLWNEGWVGPKDPLCPISRKVKVGLQKNAISKLYIPNVHKGASVLREEEALCALLEQELRGFLA